MMRFVEDTEKCEGDTRKSERDSWEIRRSEKFMGDTVDLGRYREIHVRFRDWREIMDKYTDLEKIK
jgi:hypothetical protein